MITNHRNTIKLISFHVELQGGNGHLLRHPVVRAVYPIFVWSFYLLTAVLMAGVLASGRRRR